MAVGSGTFFVSVLAVIFTTVLIPGSSAQVRLQFIASIEVPSLKCVTTPQQVDIDVKNRTVCFCIWIQNVIPTWNCLKGDGEAGFDDLKMLMETIRNLTGIMPTLPPMNQEGFRNSEMFNPFNLPDPFGDNNSRGDLMQISQDKKPDDDKSGKEVDEKKVVEEKENASLAANNKESPSSSKSDNNSNNPFSGLFF